MYLISKFWKTKALFFKQLSEFLGKTKNLLLGGQFYNPIFFWEPLKSLIDQSFLDELSFSNQFFKWTGFGLFS